MEDLKPEEVEANEPKHQTGTAKTANPVQMVSAQHRSSTLEKTVSVLRAILPIAQKVLPLIDGQIGTVVSNFIGPQSSPRQAAQILQPLQEGLALLEKQQALLRTQVAGQSAALAQMDEQIEVLRKVTEEAAEEQRNLAQSLDKIRRKFNLIAIAGFVLLAAVLALNVVVLVHARRLFQ